jgi:DNA-directed RNA polymerase subunit RPC12/RpoP
MPDFITLSCPSCGAKLEITQDVNRFACSHCGREHIVKRSGGIVSLSPVVDAINQVKTGVDKTAAELALERIPKEIEVLIAEKNSLLKVHPYPKELSASFLAIEIIAGFAFVFWSIWMFFDPTIRAAGFCALIPGILFIILGVRPILNHTTQRLDAKKLWEEKFGLRIKFLDEQIAMKQSELEHNRKLVSQ